MPKRGGGIRKKRRTHKVENDEDLRKIPKAFVIKRGKVTTGIKELVTDWKQIMSPYSALKLKENKNNRLKDFTSVSSVFGVSHLMVFTQSGTSPYWKIAHLPNGPSLTFSVLEYSLSADIRSSQLRPRAASSADFLISPLIVLHGFRETNSTVPVKLVSTFLGHMFPAIDVDSVSSKDCRRVLLFHYNKDSEFIEVRHYSVTQRQAGLSRNIRKLIRLKKNPKRFLDLGSKKDVTDFILTEGCGSDSEGEDGTEVYAATKTSTANGVVKESTSKLAISLHEIGPRMKIQLVKIEEEVFTGKVLYHKLVSKTPEEIAELERKEGELKSKRKHEVDKLDKLMRKRRRKNDETSQDYSD